MARRYFRLTEVVDVCSVSEQFVCSLEQENLITSITRKREKVYPRDQVDRIRVAQILIGELGVNLEGVEVALHMRDKIINVRRQLARLMTQLPAREQRSQAKPRKNR